MKTITKRMLLSLCVAGFISGNLDAKDLYVSATGSDTNTGTSANSPRKTLTSLTDVIEPGDVINVKGLLKILDEKPLAEAADILNSDAISGHYWENGEGHNGFLFKCDAANTNWKDITIQGEDPEEDGFDGENKTRLFHLKGGGGSTIFKNIGFYNGLVAKKEGGGAFFIHDWAIASFENCVYKGHKMVLKMRTDGLWERNGDISGERGGAICMQHSHITITDCYFTDNLGREGSCLIQNGGDLVLRGCTFEDNNAAEVDGVAIDNTVGIVHLWSLNTDIKTIIDNCKFLNNSVRKAGGAVYITNTVDYGKPMDITISNSAFIGNTCTNGQAGAIMVSNANKISSGESKKNIFVKVLNSTFYANSCKSDGGTILINGGIDGDTFDMVNCTLYGNITNGNAGHGAGILAMNNNVFRADDVVKRYYNCIIENNEARDYDEPDNILSDVFVRSGDNAALLNFDIQNCYIGRSNLDIERYGEDNKIGYSLEDPDFSDIDPEEAKYYTVDEPMMATIPLNDIADARLYGNTMWLTAKDRVIDLPGGKTFAILGYDISATDQVGYPRTIDGSQCAIGACEATIDLLNDAIDNDGKFPSNIGEMQANGALINIIGDKNEIRTIGEGAETAAISLINLSGVTVATGTGKVAISQLPQGTYLVKVKIGTKVTIQKIVK